MKRKIIKVLKFVFVVTVGWIPVMFREFYRDVDEMWEDFLEAIGK